MSSPTRTGTRRPSVWSAQGMVALAVLSFCGFVGYAALLPVVPLWVVVGGGSDAAGAGLVNFVLLGSAVLMQFFTSQTIRMIGWGGTLALGMLLLGLPAIFHSFSSELAPTLLLSAVRGMGFGILTVAASAAAVLLVPPRQRGAAVGAYAAAVSLPNVLLLPAAAWLAEAWAFWPVFAVAASPLFGLPACLLLARHLPHRSLQNTEADPEVAQHARAFSYLRILPPAFILLTITFAGGAVLTFAPQMVDVAWVGAGGLLVFGLTGALARWRIGMWADRLGAGRLLWPFVLVGVVGLVTVAMLTRSAIGASLLLPWLAACGAVGVAYGGLQTLTMVRAFEVAGAQGVGAASTIWNVCFDGGTALGAGLVGVLATHYGFPASFFLTAVVCVLVLPFALTARTGTTRPTQE